MLDIEAPGLLEVESLAPASPPVNVANRSSDALSPAALMAAAQPAAKPYSPIVVAGMVRLIEFALMVLVGSAVYVSYVVPRDGFDWLYVFAIGSIAALATLAFQIADIYQVQAFRGHEKQYFRLMAAWSVVFLIAIGATFFAKAGDQFSRVWLGSFYVTGSHRAREFPAAAVPAGARVDAPGPARTPDRDRGGGCKRLLADQCACPATGPRSADHRNVRRSER